MVEFTEIGGVSKDLATNINAYIRSMFATLKEKYPNGFDTIEERNKYQKEQYQLAGLVSPLERVGCPVQLMTDEEYDWVCIVFGRVYD